MRGTPVFSSALLLFLAAAGAGGAPPTQPPLPGDLPQGWYATIETSLGTIVARLFPEQAPQAVAHFAALAEGRLEWVDPLTGVTKHGNYYDGLKVHLAVAGQRFEAGDPTGTGRGAPPFWIPYREVDGPIKFDEPWRLGMTRASLGRISGVLFFVTATGLSSLDRGHPCFGEVVAGRDVVTSICNVKTGPGDKPLDAVVIERIRIHRVGDPMPLPEPVRYTPKPPKFGLKEHPANP